MKKKFAAVLFSGFMAASMSLPVMAASYPDVGEGDWFSEYVQDVSNLGLMTGYSNGYFGAYDNLTRGQFATILWRMSGSPSAGYDGRYPDVASDIFYAEASRWASENLVITGYSDGRFGGNDNITREQVATILKRYAPNVGKDDSAKGELSRYPDAGSVSEFARDGMEYAVGAELITGDNGNLNPQGTVNRAVASTLISRFHRAPEVTPEKPDVDLEQTPVKECSHENVDWTVVTAATCVDAGKRTGVCKDCGAELEEDIKALGHDMSIEDKETVWTWWYECNKCHEKFYNEDDVGLHEALVCNGRYSSKEEQVEQVVGHHCSRCGEKDYKPANENK